VVSRRDLVKQQQAIEPPKSRPTGVTPMANPVWTRCWPSSLAYSTHPFPNRAGCSWEI
jgi:hypothetical protein